MTELWMVEISDRKDRLVCRVVIVVATKNSPL